MSTRLASVARIGLAGLLAMALAAPAAAAAPFPDRIALPAGFAPEGITAGPGTRVFVGSLAGGAIWAGDVRTGLADLLVPAAGAVAVGTEYEHGADRLWVAGGPGPVSQVRVYDATSGDLLETYEIDPAGFLNDLVVTRDAVYVTDSAIQQLIVIPLGPGGALPAPGEQFALDVGIPFEAGFNANGIVAARGWLLVVQSNTGVLWRVDPTSGDAVAVDLGGYQVTFGDGLELHGDTLYVVRNFVNTVAVFRLGPGLDSARLLGELTVADGFDLDVPTTAAFAAGRLWAVNARFLTPPTSTTEYWLARLPARP